MQLRNTSKYLSDDDVRCFMINQLSDGEKLDMVINGLKMFPWFTKINRYLKNV